MNSQDNKSRGLSFNNNVLISETPVFHTIFT